MKERAEAIIELSKLCKPIRVTATGPVIIGPCFLFAAHITATAGGVTTNQIHRGASAADPVILDLDTLASLSFSHTFDPPIHFPRGMFLTVGLNLNSITFHLLEIKT